MWYVCVSWYPYQDGMTKLWGREDWNKSAPTRVPTSDSWQPSPRLQETKKHSFSPTRRSIMPITKYKWYDYNRQQAKDRKSGHQWMNRTGLSFALRVRRGTWFFLTEYPENLPLPGSVSIRYSVWYWTLISPPSESFSGFRKCRFKLRARSWKKQKYLIKPLPNAGTISRDVCSS